MITIPSGIKLKKEDVINAFEEEGYELLTYDFKKSKDKILVKCPKGHIDNINYDGFKQGKRCSTCKENKKYTYEFVYNYFLSQDCLLLSEEYINCKIPLEYQCSCGNKSKVSFDNFKSKNHRCKKCRNRKISESKKINYSEVKSRIELDKNELITKEEDYVDANNDIIIKCKCGIEFSTTFSRYKMRIYQNCPKCAFELAQKTHRRSEKEIKYILESYGLTLTDYNYVDNEHIVTFKCFCGNSETVNFNVFLMRIHKMCLQCSMEIRFEKSRQYSIEEIKPIFIKRNWQLLSNEFISVDHNLKCVCDKGHSTSTTLYRFINGCGCIKCFL